MDDGVQRNYQNALCCEVVEDCTTNTDNTGDGFAGCASTQCHPSAINAGIPQECTGGVQNTAYCIENPGECEGPDGLTYYCSHGITDNPSNQPEGFCCPAGTYASQNEFGEWECTESTECGISQQDFCNYDININQEGWFSSNFQGDQLDWCYSALPMLYSPIAQNQNSASAACCQIEMYGHEDYYVAEGNVRIFG